MYVRIFSFNFFNILKYVKYVFQNKKGIYSQEPKHVFSDATYVNML
jgi:hypothetical protein